MKYSCLLAAIGALALLACDGETPEDDGGVAVDSGVAVDGGDAVDAGDPADAGNVLTDAGPDPDAGPPSGDDAGTIDSGAADDAGALVDGGSSAGLVDVTIRGSVLLGNNYPQQLHPIFRASFSAGSGMGRLQLYARFCSDAACDDPIAVVPAQVSGANSEGLYVFSTASPSGGGFDKDFVIDRAPAGASFMQLVGDTERSRLWGRGSCSGVSDCPADADVIQMDGFEISANTSGGDFNPAAATTPVNVSAGGTIDLSDVLYLGHIVFDVDTVAGDPAPADTGTLLAAMSNSTNTFRNFMAIIDLDDASASPGSTTAASYVLQQGGSDYAGDVCGIIAGESAHYAIAVNISGASVFALNADGTQASTSPIVTIPPSTPGDATTIPYPCRGVYQRSGDGDAHLYLIHSKGAGSEDTSLPHPLVHVDVSDGTYETPLDAAFGQHAIRALALRGDGDLVGVDMSWSRDATNNSIGVNRLFPLSVDDSTGALSATPGAAVLTTVASNETCGSTANYPSGAALIDFPAGGAQLFVGHDSGFVAYDPSDLSVLSTHDLLDYGQLFTQFTPSRDGTRVYALPTCKTIGARSQFTLPAGAGTENADTNLVPVLDITGSTPTVATTTLDIDGDGTADHGVDMDYYRLKAYIRDFSSTLSIPPVVYVGPRMAVGGSMLFVRGSGSQFGGTAASGLGQVQDIGFFDLSTGHGAVFDGYVPWFDGLSAEGGTGAGIWGYDVWPDAEASVGAIVYIPAP